MVNGNDHLSARLLTLHGIRYQCLHQQSTNTYASINTPPPSSTQNLNLSKIPPLLLNTLLLWFLPNKKKKYVAKTLDFNCQRLFSLEILIHSRAYLKPIMFSPYWRLPHHHLYLIRMILILPFLVISKKEMILVGNVINVNHLCERQPCHCLNVLFRLSLLLERNMNSLVVSLGNFRD